MEHTRAIRELRRNHNRAMMNGHVYAADRIKVKIREHYRELLMQLLCGLLIAFAASGWFLYGILIFFGYVD